MSHLNLAKNRTAQIRASRGSTKRTRQHAAGRVGSGESTNCKSEVELIADYLTARLSPTVQRSFERHLSACSDCTAFLNTYKKTLALTSSFLKREAAKPTLSFAALRAAAQRR